LNQNLTFAVASHDSIISNLSFGVSEVIIELFVSYHPIPRWHSTLMMTAVLPNPRLTLESKKQLSHQEFDFVRVDGRFRIGKLLGTGASGELVFDLNSTLF